MEPNIVAELKQLPQFQAFLAFLATELDKLNRLDGILVNVSAEQIATQVAGKKYATETLVTILTPFLTPQTPAATSSNKDFEM